MLSSFQKPIKFVSQSCTHIFSGRHLLGGLGLRLEMKHESTCCFTAPCFPESHKHMFAKMNSLSLVRKKLFDKPIQAVPSLFQPVRRKK